MKKEMQAEVIRLSNRSGGEDLLLTKGRAKFFTIEYGGVTLVMDSTDLFDLIAMLEEVYKLVK